MQFQNISRIPARRLYTYLEPVPNWNQFMTSVGPGWIVFYIIGAASLIIAIACVLAILKFRQKIFRQSVNFVILMIICFSGLCMGLFLVFDPYSRWNHFPVFVNNMLVQVVSPCILMAFIALQNILIQAATIRVKWNKVQSIRTIVIILMLYLGMILTVEILFICNLQMKLLRLFVKLLCTIFSIYSCVCFICTGFKVAIYLETTTCSDNIKYNSEFDEQSKYDYVNMKSTYSCPGIRKGLQREQTTSSYIVDMYNYTSDSDECLHKDSRQRYRSNRKRRKNKDTHKYLAKFNNCKSVHSSVSIQLHNSLNASKINEDDDHDDEEASGYKNISSDTIENSGIEIESDKPSSSYSQNIKLKTRIRKRNHRKVNAINNVSEVIYKGSKNKLMNTSLTLTKQRNENDSSNEIETNFNSDQSECEDDLLMKHDTKYPSSSKSDTHSIERVDYNAGEDIFELKDENVHIEETTHLVNNVDETGYFADWETPSMNSVADKDGGKDSDNTDDTSEIKQVPLNMFKSPQSIHSSFSLARIRQCYMLQRVMAVAYFVTFAVVVNTIFQLYSLFGVYGIFGSGKIPEPWPWFLFHVLHRLVELTLTVSLLIAVIIVLNYKPRKRRRSPREKCNN